MMKNVDTLEDLEHFLGRKLTRFDVDDSAGHPGIRLARACDAVRADIRTGDLEAVSIACQVIGKDPRLPFGRIIKSNFARVLKQHPALLTEAQRWSLIDKTLALIQLDYCPRETEDCCKLLRKFELAPLSRKIGEVRASDPKSRKLLSGLLSNR